MDKKSKNLLYILTVIILLSIGYSIYRFVIIRDYPATSQIDCDPKTESCFYMPCTGSDCPTEIQYYKKITKNTKNIELCSTSDENCNPLVCTNGEVGCEITSCTPDNVADGEACSTSTSTESSTTTPVEPNNN